MRIIKRVILFSLLPLLVASCVTSSRQQQMALRDRYIERVVHDSIVVRDSVSLVQRADTVFVERVHTLFRDRLRVDTFMLCDTLYKEKVVRVEKKSISSYLFTPLLLLFLFLLVKTAPQILWQFLK